METPREMLEAHDLVNPTFNYEPRFNKPVLSYWIVAGLYKAFGVSVAVQRFGIAIGAIVIIGCAFVLAGIEDVRTTDHGPRTAALWAAAGLAANPRLVMFARRIFIDTWLTAFMSLTLASFALSERYPEHRRRYLTLMYVWIGLGTLTKGPVAIALPGLAIGLYLIVTRNVGRVKSLMLPLGAVIVAAIVVPWYALLHQQHGWMYIKSFVIGENVQRFTQGTGVLQHRGAWFYIPVVLSDSFPWSVLLPAAAIAAWRSPSRLQTLLWCWILAIVGFFSLSAGKQDLYIFPIVSAVAALGGLAIARGLSDPVWHGWLAKTFAAAGVLLAVTGIAVLILFETAGRVYALDAALAVGSAGLAGGVLTLGFSVFKRPGAAAAALLATVIAVDWIFVVRVLPDFEQYKPVPAFSRTLEQRLAAGDLVAHYRVDLPSMVFYLRRHIDQEFDPAKFVQVIQSSSHVYAVLSSADYAELSPQIASRTCIIDHRPTFDVKLKRVLAREPLPELLLISNQCR